MALLCVGVERDLILCFIACKERDTRVSGEGGGDRREEEGRKREQRRK